MNRTEAAELIKTRWGITDNEPTINAWRHQKENREFYRVLDRFGITYASNYYAITCVRGSHRGECLIITLGDDPFGVADISIITDYPTGEACFATWTRATFGDWVAVTNIDYLAKQTKHTGRFIAVEEKPRGVNMPRYQIKSYREFSARMTAKGYPCDRMLVRTDATGYEGEWF